MKSAEDYEECIRYYHSKLKTIPPYHPTFEKINKKMLLQIGKWAEMVQIVVYAAGNEQEPFTEKELGLPIRPMPLKKDTGFDQVGDYHFIVNGVMASLVIERKGVTREKGFMKGCDIYSTLFNRENRERFRKEFLRFQQDSRLQQFFVICECSYGEYLSFSPKFCGKKLAPIDHNGASRQSRIGTLASLELDGCHVIFAGTRLMAIELCRSLIRMWIIKNYEKILRLK